MNLNKDDKLLFNDLREALKPHMTGTTHSTPRESTFKSKPRSSLPQTLTKANPLEPDPKYLSSDVFRARYLYYLAEIVLDESKVPDKNAYEVLQNALQQDMSSFSGKEKEILVSIRKYKECLDKESKAGSKTPSEGCEAILVSVAPKPATAFYLDILKGYLYLCRISSGSLPKKIFHSTIVLPARKAIIKLGNMKPIGEELKLSADLIKALKPYLDIE